MSNKSGFRLLLACMLLLLVACKTTKIDTAQSVVPIQVPLKKIVANQQQIQTINASKVSFSIPMQNQQTPLRGSIKARIDSCMQISIQALFGIEVARIHLTQDSLILLDRINQQYVAESFSSFGSTFPVSFRMLQAIILNRLVDVTTKDDFSDFLYQKDENLHIVSYENSNFAIQYLVNDALHLLRTTVRDAEKRHYMMAEYQQFDTYNTIVYPKKNAIVMLFSQQQYAIDYSIEKVEFNQQIDLSIVIPPRYKQILLADIAKEYFN